MKKLFFMLACAASVGAYVYSPQAPEKADDLTLENIEKRSVIAQTIKPARLPIMRRESN